MNTPTFLQTYGSEYERMEKRIPELEAEVKRLQEELEGERLWIKEGKKLHDVQKDEIKRLQGKLSQTRDGVSVGKGDTVFAYFGDTLLEYITGTQLVRRPPPYHPHVKKITECYSIREAAEKEKKRGVKKED